LGQADDSVRGSDHMEIGTVKEAVAATEEHEAYLLVPRRLIFTKDTYIPLDAVVKRSDTDVFINLPKLVVGSMPWSEPPTRADRKAKQGPALRMWRICKDRARRVQSGSKVEMADGPDARHVRHRQGAPEAVADVVVEGDLPAAVRADMEAYVGCVAGALERNEYLGRLAAAGFVDARIEPTRRYRFADLEATTCCSPEVAALPLHEKAALDGRVMGAFIRARKPKTHACGGH